MLFLEDATFSSFTSHLRWQKCSLAKLLFLEVLFLAVLFLPLSKFSISYCTFFNPPSQQERLPLKLDPVTLECSTCNTSTKCGCSNNSREKTKKNSQLTSLLGQKHTLMLKLYLLLTSDPSLTSVLLQHLHASRTVAHLSILPCTGATHLCLSHYCSLLTLCCPGIPCTVALSSTPFTSISTQSVSSYYSTSGLSQQGLIQEVGYLKDPAPPPWDDHSILPHLLPGGMVACDPSAHLA